MKNEKRWIYLITASAAFLFLGLIYAWSIFRSPFMELFPEWSIAQVSMTFTISMSFFCIGGFLGGITADKLSFKVRLLIAAAVLFVGFLTVSMADTQKPGISLTILYIFYGVLGGGGVGLAYNAIIGAINKWFPDKNGLASGVMLMGFGLGGLILGSAANALIESVGLLKTLRILGIAIAIVCAVTAFIIKTASDEEFMAMKAKIPESAANQTSVKDRTPWEVLRSARFWLMIVWLILLNSGGLLVINSAADISVAYGGTAVLGMIVSIFNGAGRVVAGTNFDKRGRKTATLVNNLFMLAAGVLLSAGGITQKYIFIIAGLIFTGLAFGGCPTITSTYINRTFGTRYFPINFSLGNFSLIVGATIGPMVSSILLEAARGDYLTNFYAIIAFSAAAIVMWVLINRVSDGK